jgi:hypothetical protein
MQRIQRFATVHTGRALIRINAAVCLVISASRVNPPASAAFDGPAF